MQTLNYWKQFENTGKIEDYLSYKNSYNAVCGSATGEGAGAEGRNENLGQQGARPYAGVRMGNGNDIEADSFR